MAVGRADVGVGARVPVCDTGAPVGAGRLGAAPGCAGRELSGAVAYIGAYEGAVAVAEVFGGCGVSVAEASMEVAGSV